MLPVGRPNRIVDAHRLIGENTPRSEYWRSGSFIDTLHESQRWDTDEYWKLEWSLYSLSFDEVNDAPYADIFRIFSYVMMMIGCHFDSNDGFIITNLSAEELCSFRDRFQLVFEGFFDGCMPSQSIFDTANPLLGA